MASKGLLKEIQKGTKLKKTKTVVKGGLPSKEEFLKAKGAGGGIASSRPTTAAGKGPGIPQTQSPASRPPPTTPGSKSGPPPPQPTNSTRPGSAMQQAPGKSVPPPQTAGKPTQQAPPAKGVAPNAPAKQAPPPVPTQQAPSSQSRPMTANSTAANKNVPPLPGKTPPPVPNTAKPGTPVQAPPQQKTAPPPVPLAGKKK